MVSASLAEQPGLVHYLPIATSLVAVVFFASLLRRYRAKPEAIHLAWWAAGVACYGLGTSLEATVTLVGNSIALNKAWYIAGALLGAYPLAQGTVYLLLERRRAHLLTAVTLPLVGLLALLVMLSPVDHLALEPHRPSGDILVWTWVRFATPLINLYAVFFLVGGAVVSAWRFAQTKEDSGKALGNALIAGGALLPAIGGAMAKAGTIEALYVAELLGLSLIWAGYVCCTRSFGIPTGKTAG